MKKSILMILTLAVVVFGLSASAKSYELSKTKSQVEWEGSKGIKTLGSHNGNIAIKEGKVEIDKNGNILKAEITIDMTKITNSDLSGTMQEQLLGHLKSEDFFDVKNHKVATFKSKSVKKTSDQQYEMKGDLTIKGKTHPVIFKGDYAKNSDKHRLVGEFKFDRTDYDIRYGSGQFFQNLGDKLIHDEVLVSFDLVTN